MPNVDVVLGANVTSIAQDSELVAIACRENDRHDTLAAGYVVGCDGARSLVREHMTDQAEDLGFHERWLVVDLLLHGERPDLGDFTVQYCHPHTPTTYVRGPGLRRRWEISIGDLPDAQALAPDNIWRRLARWLTPADAGVERAAVYTFHSVIASSWRRGRLLIAGDAAHQTPPFMGQGMCAGNRDAANLAWKLAHCIRHGHDDAMLDSYQSKRHPHVRAFIEGAVDLGRLVNASDSEAALQSAFRQPDGTYKMTTISPRLGPGLWHAGLRRRRQHLPPTAPPLRQPLGRPRELPTRPPRRQHPAGPVGRPSAGREKGIHVWDSGDLDGSAEYLAELGAHAVAIRPDRYVYGTANDAASLDTLVEGLPPNPVRMRRISDLPSIYVAYTPA